MIIELYPYRMVQYITMYYRDFIIKAAGRAEFRDEHKSPVVQPLERESMQLPDMLIVQPCSAFG